MRVSGWRSCLYCGSYDILTSLRAGADPLFAIQMQLTATALGSLE
jgi:hypothetical protein